MVFYFPAVVMVIVSAAYFWLGRRESNLWVRVLFSMHGVVAALFYLGALAIWEATQAFRPWAAWPYLLLHVIPVASIVFSFVRFPGPKTLHLLQVVNLLCMLQTIFVGGMAITGDWL
jgi:hypothetical protein